MKSLTDQFKAFVDSKPRDEAYNFWDEQTCACMQFGRELGMVAEGQNIDLSPRALRNLHDRIGLDLLAQPWTFGALSDRLASLGNTGEGK